MQASDTETLASNSASMAQESPSLSPLVARLPVELEVAVPVRDFRVRTLLSFEKGKVIETQWGHSDDLPLAAGDVQLAWSEFEVVETRLAVLAGMPWFLTRMATYTRLLLTDLHRYIR